MRSEETLLRALRGGDRLAFALAGDTDGGDGGNGATENPAGAPIGHAMLSRAALLGLDAAAFLANNDSASFFVVAGASPRTGPTLTNLNDFRAILVDSEKALAR